MDTITYILKNLLIEIQRTVVEETFVKKFPPQLGQPNLAESFRALAKFIKTFLVKLKDQIHI